jgi:CRISPR-associated endonuclease/helicase Cas3
LLANWNSVLHGRLPDLPPFIEKLQQNDYNPEQAAMHARLARDLNRLNHSPIRVFSPYQMLKGMYRLKGYEALLSDYQGAAFIFDEVHAYEVNRLALILKTVEYLTRHFDARFLVMSATFPTLIQDHLVDILGNPAKIQAEPSLFARFRRHRLELLDGELLSDDALGRIEREARSGKSVLVVCNLVARAQQAYSLLQSRLADTTVPVELLHGRFNMRDRSAKEILIRKSAGTTSEQRQPVVLVATQVVEVSLDIDLDTIYTEPAPLEALVQRFGRINRKGKHTDLAPVHVFRQPLDGQRIYSPALIAATMAVLERENGQPLDEGAVGGWVDEIYAGKIGEQWKADLAYATANFEATCVDTLRPFQADDHLEDLFYRAFDGLEVLPDALYDEHERLWENEPIRASELLVPISWGRYHALMNEGRVLPRERGRAPVVKAWYDSEVGLDFEREQDTDDLWD